MLRPLALFVIVILAGAPQTSLFCKSWCASRDTAAATCHHQDESAVRVTQNQTCSEESLDVRSLVTKESHPVSASSPVCAQAFPHLNAPFALHDRIDTTDRGPGDPSGFHIPLVLRI